jgi:hypothetical protein
MDAGAAQNAASGTSANGNGNGPAGTPDPLKRLEAELEATVEQPSPEREQPDGGQLYGAPDGAQLYEEAQRLLEEAWSVFTECQVMRDGLLAACHEIERTMGSIQTRMVGLPTAIESNGHGHLANGKATLESNSNGASSNGAGRSSNGAGPSSNGASPGSNGSGPH